MLYVLYILYFLIVLFYFIFNQYHALLGKVKWSCIIDHKLLLEIIIVFISASGGGLSAVSS